MRLWQQFFAIHSRRELKELYLFSVLFSFAGALSLVFEPVFFYQQGISLALIAVYYAIHYSLYLVLLPLGGRFAARFGYERSLTVSLPVFVAYFLALAALPRFPLLFWVAVVLLTVHKTFYWPAYHSYLARYGDGANRGTELSWMLVVKYGVGIVGPVVGGFVATEFGFPVLFVVVALTVLLSVVPLLRTLDHYQLVPFHYRSPWDVIFSPVHRGMVLAMLGQGEKLIDFVFWPVWLFIVLGSVERLGVLTSLSLAVMTLMGFFIGEMSDRYSRQKILRVHVPFLSLSYLFRPFALTPVRALLTDSFGRVATIGTLLPMTYRLYARGLQSGGLRYVVAFEMVLCIAKAGTALLLAAVFLFAAPSVAFTFMFVLAAALSLLYVFL